MIRLPLELMKAFICRAEAVTFGEKGLQTPPRRPEAYEIQYREGDFTFIDRYWGGEDRLGRETLYLAGRPVWTMNYYGRLLKPGRISPADAALVIQESLIALANKGDYSGDFQHRTVLGEYRDETRGSFAAFAGREWIIRNREKVYECFYHGGLTRSRSADSGKWHFTDGFSTPAPMEYNEIGRSILRCRPSTRDEMGSDLWQTEDTKPPSRISFISPAVEPVKAPPPINGSGW